MTRMHLMLACAVLLAAAVAWQNWPAAPDQPAPRKGTAMQAPEAVASPLAGADLPALAAHPLFFQADCRQHPFYQSECVCVCVFLRVAAWAEFPFRSLGLRVVENDRVDFEGGRVFRAVLEHDDEMLQRLAVAVGQAGVERGANLYCLPGRVMSL